VEVSERRHRHYPGVRLEKCSAVSFDSSQFNRRLIAFICHR
jgi:hypothetical protein